MLGWLKRPKQDPKAALKAMLGDFELPTFPKVVMEALQLLRDPNSSLTQIGEKVSADPGTSVKILNIANSASYALRNPVRSVEHAASLLGRNDLEALLLTAAVGQALPKPKVAGYDPVQFWTAAARRAAVARALAYEVAPASKGECFSAALLGDMAIPLILTVKGGEYSPILQSWREDGHELAGLEHQAFGWTHAFAAGCMSEHWKFPEPLVQAIGAHHDEAESDKRTGGLQCVRVAGLLREGTDDATELIETGARELGLKTEHMAKVVRGAFDNAEDIRRQFAA